MRYLPLFLLASPALAHGAPAPHMHPMETVALAAIAALALVAAYALWTRRA